MALGNGCFKMDLGAEADLYRPAALRVAAEDFGAGERDPTPQRLGFLSDRARFSGFMGLCSHNSHILRPPEPFSWPGSGLNSV